MRADAAGLAFLSREEGLRTAPYNDSVGHATIGVGHLIHHGPVTAADRRRYAHFTRKDALDLLLKDAAERERAITRLITVPMNQNEFNALLSLVFNIGVGGFEGSTVRKRLNAGDRHGAADAFRMWKIPPELKPRRERERTLFLKLREDGGDPLDALLTKTEARLVRELDHLRAINRNAARRKEILAFLTERRKALAAYTARHGGKWDARRLARYRILKTRTT